MASSSLLQNATTLEIVPHVPELKKSKDQALLLAMEQPPVVISLITVPHSRENRTPDEGACVMLEESTQHEFTFKLPRGYSVGIFVTMVQEGSTKEISWSKLINFDIPDDTVNYILAKDLEAEVARIPLRDRLEGWQIEQRPRNNSSRADKFFYHRKSGGRFRSFVEVQQYIIHAGFPISSKKPEQRSAPPVSKSSKRKRKGVVIRNVTEDDLRDSNIPDEQPVIFEEIKDLLNSENDEEEMGNLSDGHEARILELMNELTREMDRVDPGDGQS